MEFADTRLNFAELGQLEQVFAAVFPLYTGGQSIAKNLVRSHRGSTSMISCRPNGLLKLLLARDVLGSGCELKVCNCPIHTIHDCSDRRRRPVRHTISKPHIIVVLLKLCFTTLLQIEKQFGALILLGRLRVLQPNIIACLAEAILGRCGCDSVLGCQLVEHLEVLVIGQGFLFDMMGLPLGCQTSHVDGIRSVSVAKGVIAFGQVEGAWGGTTYVTLLQETVRA